jgi:hypothetical protein
MEPPARMPRSSDSWDEEAPTDKMPRVTRRREPTEPSETLKGAVAKGAADQPPLLPKESSLTTKRSEFPQPPVSEATKAEPAEPGLTDSSNEVGDQAPFESTPTLPLREPPASWIASTAPTRLRNELPGWSSTQPRPDLPIFIREALGQAMQTNQPAQPEPTSPPLSQPLPGEHPLIEPPPFLIEALTKPLRDRQRNITNTDEAPESMLSPAHITEATDEVPPPIAVNDVPLQAQSTAIPLTAEPCEISSDALPAPNDEALQEEAPIIPVDEEPDELSSTLSDEVQQDEAVAILSTEEPVEDLPIILSTPDNKLNPVIEQPAISIAVDWQEEQTLPIPAIGATAVSDVTDVPPIETQFTSDSPDLLMLSTFPTTILSGGPIFFEDDLEEDDMAKTYEYCRLALDSGRYSQQAGRYPYFIRITLNYYGASVSPTSKFTQDTDEIEGPDKAWGRMLGQLGAAGWEMINLAIGKARDLSLLEATAYFKRPIEEGRAIDQPQVSL